MGRNNKHKRSARNKRGPVRSERRPSMTGRVQLHEHSAYVVTDNGDYKVMGRGKREIMDGDTVAVSIKRDARGSSRRDRGRCRACCHQRSGYVSDGRPAWCDRTARFASQSRFLCFARGHFGGAPGCASWRCRRRAHSDLPDALGVGHCDS